MSLPPARLVLLTAFLWPGTLLLAGEPAPKPAKSHLIPRPLPGSQTSLAPPEQHQVRPPVFSDTNRYTPGTAPVTPSEKARIGIIRRGESPVSGPPGESPRASNSQMSAAATTPELQPALRSGQFRVLPKTEADSVPSAPPNP